jgi:hypothetical protein
MTQTTIKQVPVTALSAPATLLMDGKEDQENQWPIKLQARSKEVLDHWYWGRMVHDFAGMEHKEKIPVDYCHDSWEVMGFCDQFEVTDYGLELSGQVVSASEADRSAEVALKAKAGNPYEPSINYSHEGLQTEYIPEGRTAQVNGEELAGPLTIFRNWKLMGVAVCLFGYDSNTSTEMSKRDQFIEISISGGEEMPNKGTKTEQTKTDNSTDLSNQETESGTKTEPGKKETGLAKSRDDVRSELELYVERFGSADGTQYFIEKLSLETSLDRHARKLETDLEAKEKEITELKAKLEAVELGETDSVSSGESQPGGKASTKTGLEAAIRMPGQS